MPRGLQTDGDKQQQDSQIKDLAASTAKAGDLKGLDGAVFDEKHNSTVSIKKKKTFKEAVKLQSATRMRRTMQKGFQMRIDEQIQKQRQSQASKE